MADLIEAMNDDECQVILTSLSLVASYPGERGLKYQITERLKERFNADLQRTFRMRQMNRPTRRAVADKLVSIFTTKGWIKAGALSSK